MRDGPRDHDAEHEPGRLRYHGRNCGAGDSRVHPMTSSDGRRHVDEVDGNLHREREPGARLSDQPAEHDEIGEHNRRRPDPDGEVGPCGAGDAFAAAHGVEQDQAERNLQDDQGEPDQRRDDEAAHQERADLLHLAGAERLRREGDRAHAQKGKQPEQAVENHRGDRDAAEQRGIAEPSDRDRRDDADQRRRQIRHHRRSRDGENPRARHPGIQRKLTCKLDNSKEANLQTGCD